MPGPDKNKLLADEILKILSKGLTLGSDVIDYIDSTFSNPTIEELNEILQDDANCEKDSLIELLFFPDESLQHRLEDFLESWRFEEGDEKKVLDHLYRNPLAVEFHFPQNKGFFSLEIPESVAVQFVKRLKISKQLDRGLLLTLKDNTSAIDKIRFAVKLRNSRFATTDKAVAFLSAFFEKWQTDNSDVFKYVDFILLFLEELQAQDDIFEALMKKKRFYLKHLKRSEKFEEQLLKTNMETLMLKGQTAAFIDMNEARKNMAIIDGISLTVFAKTEHYETLFGPPRDIEFRLK
jgi:hypothetical protein